MTAEARIVREMLIQPHDQRPALVDPFLRATLSPNPESDQPANPHVRSPEPKSSTRVETLRWASQHCSLGCNLNWRAGQATSLLVSSLFASKKGMEKRVMNEWFTDPGINHPRLKFTPAGGIWYLQSTNAVDFNTGDDKSTDSSLFK